MKPTIEEVKKVCEQCGMFPPSNFTALQAFAQHFMNKQRESDTALRHDIIQSLPIAAGIFLEGINEGVSAYAKAIRNNTGE